MHPDPTHSPAWVIPPDFATGEIGQHLRDDPILAAQLFDPAHPMVQDAIAARRRQFELDDDTLAEQMRYAYETNQRAWLLQRARFDREQFLRVATRIGATARKRRGRRPMVDDAQAATRQAVVRRVREVWGEYPNLSLEDALIRIGYGHLEPRTVRDWLERFKNPSETAE